MTNNAELLPCPFCGSTDILVVPDDIGSGGQWVSPIHVVCDNCKVEQQDECKNIAIRNWNTRAQTSVPDGWKLAPLEPDDVMVAKGTDCHVCEQADSYYPDTQLSDSDCIAIYKAMLEVIPQSSDHS
jgi:Lar family restriction alleviation protein